MLKAYFHLVIPESKEVINVFIKENEITKTEITKNKTTKTFKQTTTAIKIYSKKSIKKTYICKLVQN